MLLFNGLKDLFLGALGGLTLIFFFSWFKDSKSKKWYTFNRFKSGTFRFILNSSLHSIKLLLYFSSSITSLIFYLINVRLLSLRTNFTCFLFVLLVTQILSDDFNLFNIRIIVSGNILLIILILLVKKYINIEKILYRFRSISLSYYFLLVFFIFFLF